MIDCEKSFHCPICKHWTCHALYNFLQEIPQHGKPVCLVTVSYFKLSLIFASKLIF